MCDVRGTGRCLLIWVSPFRDPVELVALLNFIKFYLPLPEVYDEYEESSTPIESDLPPEEDAPMLKKAFAGMGDPDADETGPKDDEGAVTAGRYGAPRSLPGGQGGGDSADDESSTDTLQKPPTTVTMTTESHPGAYSERDPILKGSLRKPGGSQFGGYEGPLAKTTPQGGLKVNTKASCIWFILKLPWKYGMCQRLFSRCQLIFCVRYSHSPLIR